MNLKKIIYCLAAAFIVGNLMLLYIHYNSSKSVNNLIDGNKKILAEIGVTNELRELNKDIAAIEGRNRGTKMPPDSNQVKEFTAKIEKVQFDLDNLQKISDDDSTEIYIDQLDLLVHEKMNYPKSTNSQKRSETISSADSVAFENRSRKLNDSIRLVTHQIENSRQKLLLASTLSTEKSGRKALSSGTLLIIIVLVCGAVLFLIILNRIVRQYALIQELNVSEKRVRETARLQELFIANMSHEIRTPMNAIVGFTGLLQKKELDDESRGYIKTIQQSGEMLLDTINDVLDLSKIEAGMMHLDSYPFSLPGLFKSVINIFQVRFLEKGITLSTDIEKTLPESVEGDPARLRQILMNLIGNALKFTSHGTVTIMISNEGIHDDHVQVGIRVKDTGIGIRKANLKSIFDRFQQAEDSITRNYGGTGLGLAIVKDLVTLLKGNISVESEPGKGSCFDLMIPFKIHMGLSKAEPTGIPQSTPRLTDCEILIVEDNAVNRLLIGQLFKIWKIRYDSADNGRQAIDKLKKRKYNMILMDIQMPEMDGYMTTKEIRQKLRMNTPIIAMTAHALHGEREKCLDYGMNDYISKPIRETQLYDLIVHYIGFNPNIEIQHGAPCWTETKNFEQIDLDYMKEVSKGNLQYEKAVTAEFLTAIPRELDSILKAWNRTDTIQIKKLAHNMKTTISVMGLTEKLQPFLDRLEYEDLSEHSFTYSFETLGCICEKALEEASEFYKTLPAD